MSRYHATLQMSTITLTVSPSGFRGNDNVRQKINGFSYSAGQRMRRYLRSCVADYRYMFTLTYPAEFPLDGRLCKRQLKRLFQRIDRLFGHDPAQYGNENADGSVFCKRRYSLFWFFEFQERGAPHFHVFSTHQIDRHWLAKAWYEIVGSDDERHLRAGTRIESLRTGRGGTISYASKYAAKQEQKTVPEKFLNTGRFWGVSGNRKCMSAATVCRVTNDNMQSLIEISESAEKILQSAVNDGRLVRIPTKRVGAWSFYAVDDVGLRVVRGVMKRILEDFTFAKCREDVLYDIMNDWSL